MLHLVEEAIGEARKERASARYMAYRVQDDDSDKEEQFRFFDEAGHDIQCKQ